MPIGYLVSVAIVALGTLFALAPARKPPLLAGLSFRVGIVVNGMPFLAALWLLLWTLVALSQGDIAGPGGWAVAGLALLTLAGLALVVRRELLARPATERALRNGLGAGWSAASEHRRIPWPWPRVLAAPFLMRRGDVVRVSNIRYGDAGRRNLLDLYRPRESSQPEGAPVLVHMHGGGYSSGHKSSQSLPLIERLASQGWVCISANYRLQPETRHPDHLIDLKRVIAWVREHGQEYGADPATLVVAGSSAGAHLAALAALTPGDPAFQPGFEQIDTSITAAICLNGYFGGYSGGYEGQGDGTSPFDYVNPAAPPFFIAHGELDSLVPVASARAFAEAVRRVSHNPVVYVELPGGQHAFDLFHSLRFEAVVDGIESFTAWLRARRPVPVARLDD